MVDPDRLVAAYETARCDLLAEADSSGHWTGLLSSSPLSTATAISALTIVERNSPTLGGRIVDESRECRLSELIVASVRWLARHQNADGGWGDTDKSHSNIATTMLVRAAFALTAVPADCPGLLERADAYIESQGGLGGLKRRYGRDKTFAVPILTNCALAGLVPWRKVSSLPFELACFPRQMWKMLRLPVVSYAMPAMIAIGQARYHHLRPWNPITRIARHLTRTSSLRLLEDLQPESGGFLEAAPLTSFVVMSLASIGQVGHPVVRKGVEFLLASVRPDGSWPIDTNLATWNTTLALNALAASGEDVRETGALEWLLECQHRQVHPYTGAEPGGWAWTDRSGGVPDADDTSGALLALLAWWKVETSHADRTRLLAAAGAGVGWLLDLQNFDGGWPTFCRGWGKLPFDRSGSDLTAHALRAIHGWRTPLVNEAQETLAGRSQLDRRITLAIERGMRFLGRQQRADGSWTPLWFGNQHQPNEENPIYGTAKVLAAYRDLGRLDAPQVSKALAWMVSAADTDGAWGAPRCADPDAADSLNGSADGSIEETALAVEALLTCGRESRHQTAGIKGLKWLVDAVEANRHLDSSPIGLYFAKLWYYEKLYPLIHTVSTLGQAASMNRAAESATAIHSGKR